MKTVLIVDDEPVIRSMLREILHDEGYGVVEAANGRAMLDIVVLERPDLVLMDVMMPDGDGRDGYRALRAREDLPVIPVVMMSAAVHPTGLDPSIAGFLQKPFDLTRLLTLVIDLIGAPTTDGLS